MFFQQFCKCPHFLNLPLVKWYPLPTLWSKNGHKEHYNPWASKLLISKPDPQVAHSSSNSFQLYYPSNSLHIYAYFPNVQTETIELSFRTNCESFSTEVAERNISYIPQAPRPLPLATPFYHHQQSVTRSLTLVLFLVPVVFCFWMLV